LAKLFHLKILTPERQFFEGDVESLTVTTTDGRYSFLAGHVPTVMPVAVGSLVIKSPDGTEEAFASEGFLEVDHEGLNVYVQACEHPGEIDENRAEEARRRAEERLRQRRSMTEYGQSKMAMARALARLQISKRNGYH
jgi:F-type H+-transporting ATPase subunit epsilon